MTIGQLGRKEQMYESESTKIQSAAEQLEFIIRWLPPEARFVHMKYYDYDDDLDPDVYVMNHERRDINVDYHLMEKLSQCLNGLLEDGLVYRGYGGYIDVELYTGRITSSYKEMITVEEEHALFLPVSVEIPPAREERDIFEE